MSERLRQSATAPASDRVEAAPQQGARARLDARLAAVPYAEQVQLLRPPLPLGAAGSAPQAAGAQPIQAAGLKARYPLAPVDLRPAGGAGESLPADVQHKMEGAFGADFSSVRVHQDASAADIGALAYTRGRDIHFAPGRYEPHRPDGQRLLGHELTHVVQQSEGRVSAPAGAGGVPINANPALEAEADRHGEHAARGDQVGGGAQRVGLFDGLIAQFDLVDKLKADQLKALTSNEAIKGKLEALYGEGFALSSTSGRIVYRKGGSFADAKANATTHLGMAMGTNKLAGKDNNAHGVPKELYNASIDGCTVNVRNVSSEDVPGTIEVHVGDFIFEFKYEG